MCAWIYRRRALFLTGLTLALTLTSPGEWKRTSYPRGPKREGEGGVWEDCQRLLSALMWGLERAEGTVSLLEVVSALVTLSGCCLEPWTALLFQDEVPQWTLES